MKRLARAMLRRFGIDLVKYAPPDAGPSTRTRELSYFESSSAMDTSFSRTPGTNDRGRCTAHKDSPWRAKKLIE